MLPQFLGWPTTISKIISNALEAVFSTLVKPLVVILQAIFIMLAKLLYALFSNVLRSWLYMLLGIVDFLQGIFDIFAGVDTVKYKGEDMYLLDAFISQDIIKNAMVMVTFIGVALCFIFTIYTVGKSIGTHVLENKHPVGHIMGQALKACLAFMIVPLMAYFGLQLSTAILVSTDRAVNNAMGSDDTVPFSTVLFLSGTFNEETDADFSTGVRADYLSGRKSVYNDLQVCRDFPMITMDVSVFDMLKNSLTNTDATYYIPTGGTYNYFLVYCEAIFVIIVMICAVFLFVRRIIEVLILYVTAPLFVSTIPLDDGRIFKRWRELFIGKLISGFGVVFTMKLVMILIPVVVSGNFRFTGNSMVDGAIKTIFAIGSIFAAFKSQHTILEAFSPEIAMAAKESTGSVIRMGKQAINLGVQAGMAVATGGASAAASAAGAAASAAGAAGAAGTAASAAGAAGAAGSGAAFTGGAGAVGGLSTGAGSGASGASAAGGTTSAGGGTTSTGGGTSSTGGGTTSTGGGTTSAGGGTSSTGGGTTSTGGTPAKTADSPAKGGDTSFKGGQGSEAPAKNSGNDKSGGISAKDIADSISSGDDEKSEDNDELKG